MLDLKSFSWYIKNAGGVEYLSCSSEIQCSTVGYI